MYLSIGNYFHYHLQDHLLEWLSYFSGSNERIKIATMNVRSIKPKIAPFSEYLTSKNLDIVAVTETWLKHD